MTKLASNSRHNNALNYLNGVVGGSNPPTPTIDLSSKSPVESPNIAIWPLFVNTFVNSAVNKKT
jgi:hypothetical protein